MNDKKRMYYLCSLVIIACLTMAWVELVLSPVYLVKSVIKLFLFLVIPLGYCFMDKEVSFTKLFVLDKKQIAHALILGFIVYVFILGSYLLIGPFFDFSNVTVTLENNIGVNKTNFVFVALYISFINSFLEEFFFRGFSFLSIKILASRKVAYVFSASAFSIYHVAIMTGWFTPVLFILLIFSLFVAGIIFNWLNERSNTIYPSWIVHLSANLAINTIGFMLFGII